MPSLPLRFVSRPPRVLAGKKARPAIIGHRGTRGVFPENTLLAIEEAHRQGADAVEVDVRLARTGQVVVAHDPDLKRIAERPELVEDLSWHELAAIDLGEGARIPRLDDVVTRCRELDLGLNVEIKHDVRDRWQTVRAVAAILSRARTLDLVVSSVHPATLVMHRALVPRLCHAQIVQRSNYTHWALRVARALRFDGVHFEHVLVEPTRVRPFRRGAYFSAWTVNDPAVARSMFELGTEALITDKPAEMLRSFAGGIDAEGP